MPRSSDSESDSVAPPAADDRNTARKIAAAVPVAAPDSSQPGALQEDFLFHIYRGSELLQENRVHEAKEELERALALQPGDSKGQDLLAAVYFRIGHYARAITLYEELEQVFPRDTSLKVNLALCYLKTATTEHARTTLYEVVRINPNHRRAWGYLGFAHEQLGEFDQAQVAFERGGHAVMAKRMAERRNRATVPAPAMPPAEVATGEETREAAGIAFEELDAGELNFELAEPGTLRDDKQGWHAGDVGAPPEPHEQKVQSAFAKTLCPPSVRSGEIVDMRVARGGRPDALTVTPPPSSKFGSPGPTPVISAPPPELTRAARESLLLFPEESSVVLHPSGVALVQTRRAPNSERGFALRLDAMRASKGLLSTSVLQRKTRDKEMVEVLGSLVSPIVRVDGNAELVVGSRPGHQLVPLELQDDLAFVREDLLLGFESTLAYENGKLSLEESDPIAIVQLRGSGTLILELLAPFSTIDASPSRSVLVRRDWVVGWMGRLVPRALPSEEAPAGQRGLISFSGEGTVLIAGR